MKVQGEVLSKEEILNRLWQLEFQLDILENKLSHVVDESINRELKKVNVKISTIEEGLQCIDKNTITLIANNERMKTRKAI